MCFVGGTAHPLPRRRWCWLTASPRQVARSIPCQVPFPERAQLPAGPLGHDEQRPGCPRGQGSVASASVLSCHLLRQAVLPSSAHRRAGKAARAILDDLASGAPCSWRLAGDLQLPGRDSLTGAGACQHASCGWRVEDRAPRATVRPVLAGDSRTGLSVALSSVTSVQTVPGALKFSRSGCGWNSCPASVLADVGVLC